jgi:hypothetical protein
LRFDFNDCYNRFFESAYLLGYSCEHDDDCAHLQAPGAPAPKCSSRTIYSAGGQRVCYANYTYTEGLFIQVLPLTKLFSILIHSVF